MDLIKEIEDLKIKAKEGEIYKDKFNELKVKVKNVLEELTKLVDSEIDVKLRTSSGDGYKIVKWMPEFAQNLYEQMKLRNMDVNKKYIHDILIEKKLCVDSNKSYALAVLSLISKLPGIKQRSDGTYKIILYYDNNYDKPNTENSELLNSLPKKFSFKN